MAQIKQVLEGKKIVSKYLKKKRINSFEENGNVYCDYNGDDMNKQDLKRMESLGWVYKKIYSTMAYFTWVDHYWCKSL